MSQTAPLRPKELSHDYRQKRQNYHKKKQLKNEQDDLDIVPEFYTQLKKVGEGTYAQSVFKAFDSKKGEWVAVKVLKIESETQLRYVNEEVSILEMMSAERNVVSLFESHRVGDRMLLVFEYMDFDLFALMTTRATNSFTEPENKYIMIQILRGLEQMKQHGIMHRDVKAANILVDKSGHVKIGDLGTATRTNRNKFHASVCTLWYRPPELLLGSTNYSYEIDTWAAGCVFVELLSSCFFLRGESEKDQFTRVFEFFGSFPADEFFNDLPRKEWISETTATKKNSTLPYYMQRYVNELGVDLLSRMFEYIPRNRFLPDQCLKHDYFRLHPLPSTSLSLSDTQEIHGFEAMKQSAKEKKTKAYLPPHPSKRRASDYDPQFFKRGRNRYTTKRRRYNYPQEQVKEVQKPMKVLNQKVLPFFTHMEIVPELTKFDRGAGSLTSEYLDPNRLAALGVVNIPQMKSPTIEDNLFF